MFGSLEHPPALFFPGGGVLRYGIPERVVCQEVREICVEPMAPYPSLRGKIACVRASGVDRKLHVTAVPSVSGRTRASLAMWLATEAPGFNMNSLTAKPLALQNRPVDPAVIGSGTENMPCMHAQENSRALLHWPVPGFGPSFLVSRRKT